MKLLRAFAFGLVLSVVLSAMGIKMWSIHWWLSLVIAYMIFELIDYLLFDELNNEKREI